LGKAFRPGRRGFHDPVGSQHCAEISIIALYTMNPRTFDAAVAVFMGGSGYFLLRMNWPVLNWGMGLVLGNILENRLHEC
jgi:TctA family transporter